MNETDVRELFASAVEHPAVDRIDVDAAVRGGRRRRRVRRAASTTAVVAVLALAGGATMLVLPDGATESANPVTPSVTGSASSRQTAGPGTSPAVRVTDASQLAGRWLAQTLRGKDVSAYRDREGKPLAVTFGTQGKASMWEASGACSPWIGGFAVRTDGSFRPEVRGPLVYVACPDLQKVFPDIVGAIGATRSLTLTPGTGAAPATLTMSDAQGQVIATWLAAPA